MSSFGAGFTEYQAALAKAAEQAAALAEAPAGGGKKAPPAAKGAPAAAAGPEDIESLLPVPSKQVGELPSVYASVMHDEGSQCLDLEQRPIHVIIIRLILP